ncbi:apolipoprotein N-acyltransferase [Hoyosella sp. G463]|uniref:Apolipoprotein N-acyltransferase n=1 Tax=Lolliginicoccus lacisalsi TaxID=2742202 RepID=A0A927PMN7_9ACTN|nr:apolipoprotein N-acyltransferase [Lolliginicoccus lacisalsi]MBD8506827.1 apolipoprotein N-acyltransferase [Lolliginicoccus lacisalsi]
MLLSVLAGILLYLSFPPSPHWYAAPLGIALLVGVLTGWAGRPISARAGFGHGFLAGAGFFIPLLPWIGMYVGALPWLALALVCALYMGLFGAGAAVAWRLPRYAAIAAIPAVWAAAEWLRSSFPFGGFPWGRLAFGQSGSPLLPVAALGGAPLLSAAVALLGMAVLLLGAAIARRDIQAGAATVVSLGLVLGTAAAMAPTASPAPAGAPTLTVAAVQGNVPRLGLDFNAQRRAVLSNHVEATLELAAAVERGEQPRPDVVIWPENSSDVDPLRDAQASSLITGAARTIGAPIVVGAVLYNGDGTFTNSVIAWDPLAGPVDRHDKAIIQPFGEYMPMRGFFRLFSDYVDLAGNFVPGDSDWVINAGGVPLGIATCYEVAFDRAFATAVRSGAQILAVPTNNATFTTPDEPDMTYQQLAMSRVRAVEHGRAVVVAATSGVSALVRPDGSIIAESGIFERDVLVADLPLSTTLTVATRLGAWPERGLVAAAVLALAVAVARGREHAREDAGAPVPA